jgi:hypothetical protein
MEWQLIVHFWLQLYTFNILSVVLSVTVCLIFFQFFFQFFEFFFIILRQNSFLPEDQMLHQLPIDTKKTNVDVKLIEDGRASTHGKNVDQKLMETHGTGNRSFLSLVHKKNRMPLPIVTTFHIKSNVDQELMIEDGRALTLAAIPRDPKCMCHGCNDMAPIVKSFETITPGWTNGRVVINRKKLSTNFTSAPRNFRIDFFLVLIVIVITVSVVIFIVIVIMSPK